MKLWMKRLLTAVLAAMLVIPFLPVRATVTADADTVEKVASEPVTFRNEKQMSPRRDTAKSDAAATPNKAAPALPASYSSVEQGYISPVRNQGVYGTCWAFGALASCEAYMVKNGIPAGSVPAQAGSINLSEYHLSYFSYADAYDALNLTRGDENVPNGEFYKVGGNGEVATYTLMRWEGLASESTPALAYSAVNANGLSSDYAYEANVAHVQDCDWIPANDQTAIKQAILKFGAGTMGYYHSSTYFNASKAAYCYIADGDPRDSNHDVTVVGWDDNFDRSNFKSACRPKENGAWLIKGSYGSSYGQNGYYYISYEDSAMLNDLCYFYTVEPVDNYDYNYQYDGTCNFLDCEFLESGNSVANIFTASGAQTVEAASICTWSSDVAYTCAIYTGLEDDGFSTEDAPAATVSGTFPYMGYHTVSFDVPALVDAGERFAVVFTLRTDGGTVIVPTDISNAGSWVSWTHAERPGTSFYRITDSDTAWIEEDADSSFRIKAYTNQDTGTVAARPDNAEHGTVSVRHKTVYAEPAPGYSVSGYRIISGNATVKRDGDTFAVTTADACVIEIVFIRKTYTVTFSSPTPSTFINVQAFEHVTMPSYNIAVYGNTHVGWSETEQIVPTETPPRYYAPGSTDYVATGSVTLYALFSYASPSDQTVTLYSTVQAPCPHDYVRVSYTEPSCTVNGLAVYQCSHCYAVYRETIASIPHTPSEWIIDTAATFDAPGEHHRVCTVCEAVLLTEIIPKLTWENPFRDVSENTWYYEAVRYVNYYGYIKGTNDGSTFEPDTVTTRAMFVNILYRLEKDPAVHENRFTDVPSSAWYEPGISWAAGEGVVKGTSETTFSPNSNLDRQQMATMLYNYARFKGQDMDSTGDCTAFEDGADVDDWARPAVNWALGKGLISGTSQSERILKPNGQATRATVAVILMKFLQA